MALFFGALLGVDHFVGRGGQVLLAVATWGVLLAVCCRLAPERRAQVAIVVAVASCAEVIGSIVWGVYAYRLGNLPPFVPPAHGLVYLTGLHLSECAVVRRHARIFVLGVLAGAALWATAGLTVLPRADVAGAVGAVALAIVLLRSRAAPVYAGVFVAVAALELYGTAIGTWRWAEAIPGLGVSQGNPPSGVASGYVFFDVVALALAPLLVAGAERARTSSAWALRRAILRPALLRR